MAKKWPKIAKIAISKVAHHSKKYIKIQVSKGRQNLCFDEKISSAALEH